MTRAARRAPSAKDKRASALMNPEVRRENVPRPLLDHFGRRARDGRHKTWARAPLVVRHGSGANSTHLSQTSARPHVGGPSFMSSDVAARDAPEQADAVQSKKRAAECIPKCSRPNRALTCRAPAQQRRSTVPNGVCSVVMSRSMCTGPNEAQMSLFRRGASLGAALLKLGRLDRNATLLLASKTAVILEAA